MDSQEEIFRLLDECRAELVRHKKHYVYRLPNGKIFVAGKTLTGDRGWRNNLAQLRKLLRTELSGKKVASGKRKLIARKNKRTKEPPDFVSVQTSAALRSLGSELRKSLPDFVTRPQVKRTNPWSS